MGARREVAAVAHLLRITEKDSEENDDKASRSAVKQLAKVARKTWDLRTWENASLEGNIACSNRPTTRIHLLLEHIEQRDPMQEENMQA